MSSVRLTMLMFPKNMIHIAKLTIGRRYAGWFICNLEHVLHVLNGLCTLPLPGYAATRTQGKGGESKGDGSKGEAAPRTTGQEVAWGGAKAI